MIQFIYHQMIIQSSKNRLRAESPRIQPGLVLLLLSTI